MPEQEQAYVTFAGPTILARAFCTVEKAGYSANIVSAPGGGSPCGLALAVAPTDLAAVVALLQAHGVRPYGLAPAGA